MNHRIITIAFILVVAAAPAVALAEPGEPEAADDTAPACPREGCERDGVCTLVGERCLATGLDCQRAAICREEGRCHAFEGRCVAAADDCRAAPACKEEGRCSAVGGSCAATNDASCAASAVCAREGRCVARHDGWCTASPDVEPAQLKPARAPLAGSSGPSDRSTWPRKLPYYEDEPIPDGYRPITHPRWGYTATGIALLGGTWVASVAAAIMLDDAPDGSNDPNFDDNYTPLFIPLAGPFITIATADASGTGAAILALDGAAQLASVALIIIGIADPVTELERKEVPWRLTPTVSPQATGLSLEGAF